MYVAEYHDLDNEVYRLSRRVDELEREVKKLENLIASRKTGCE